MSSSASDARAQVTLVLLVLVLVLPLPVLLSAWLSRLRSRCSSSRRTKKASSSEGMDDDLARRYACQVAWHGMPIQSDQKQQYRKVQTKSYVPTSMPIQPKAAVPQGAD